MICLPLYTISLLMEKRQYLLVTSRNVACEPWSKDGGGKELSLSPRRRERRDDAKKDLY